MATYVKAGINIVKIQQLKEDEAALLAETQRQTAHIHQMAGQESYAVHQSIEQERKKRTFVLQSYKLELDAMLSIGKISAEDHATSQRHLDDLQTAADNNARDAHAAEKNSLADRKKEIFDNAVGHKVAHDERMKELDKLEKAAKGTSEKAKAQFEEIMQGLPDQIQQVVELLKGMGLSDFIAEIMDAFGITAADLGITTGEINDAVESGKEAIENTLDLRDYVSYVGGTALGQTGRVGGVFESGQQSVEPSENFQMGFDSKRDAYSDGYSINNEVHIEIDGETMVKGNIQSKGLATLANVPGA